MDIGTQRQARRVGGAPRIACTTCGLRIPLERVVPVGHHRVLVCDRCQAIDLWEVNSAASVAKGLDLLDEACRSMVERIPRHRP